MTEHESLSAYFSDVSNVPLLAVAEERALFRRLRAGDHTVRERIAAANQRLVVKVARKYTGHGISLADLIGEGNVGLMRAIDKFDLGRGCRLSTYAIHWIRQAVARAIHEKANTVRPPVDLTAQMPQYRRSVRALELKLGRRPATTEVARALHLSRSKVERLDRAQCALQGATPLSDFDGLDSAPVSQIHERDPGAAGLQKVELQDMLDCMMIALGEREREVLKFRYGLGGERPLTLRELGQRHRLTRARIGQIEKRAIAKMGALFTPDGAAVSASTSPQ